MLNLSLDEVDVGFQRLADAGRLSGVAFAEMHVAMQAVHASSVAAHAASVRARRARAVDNRTLQPDIVVLLRPTRALRVRDEE